MCYGDTCLYLVVEDYFYILIMLGHPPKHQSLFPTYHNVPIGMYWVMPMNIPLLHRVRCDGKSFQLVKWALTNTLHVR